jgi:hypothetical protein
MMARRKVDEGGMSILLAAGTYEVTVRPIEGGDATMRANPRRYEIRKVTIDLNEDGSFGIFGEVVE